MDEYKTMVVFRVWKQVQGSGVIVLFPMTINESRFCESYEHKSPVSRYGQHGTADYSNVISRTRPATPEDAIDLADELKDIGYNLAVRQKHPSEDFAEKWRAKGNR